LSRPALKRTPRWGCRRSNGHPGRPANDRSPWVRGGSAGLRGLPQRLPAFAGLLRSSPHRPACRSRFTSRCRSRSSAAPGPLRVPRGSRPTIAEAGVGVARAASAFGVVFFRGRPHPPPLPSFFWVVGWGDITHAIDTPTENLAAVGSISNATASSLPACAGQMPPPRHLAPLDPSHPGSLPAFDTAAPRPGSRQSVPGRLGSLDTLPPAPPPAAESWERASGTSFEQSTPRARACRLRSRRRKWNLFDGRPLFHLPRRLSPAAVAKMVSAESQNKFGKLVGRRAKGVSPMTQPMASVAVALCD